MAQLPTASLLIDDAAGAFATGVDYIAIFACVSRNADMTPRVFASAKGILDEHDYSPGGDYAASHIDGTKKPVLFIGLPISSPGVLGRVNSTGVTGSCAISVADTGHGFMEETQCSINVAVGGTVGTTGIQFDFSADGGRTTKRIRLGTANSYTVPYLGIVLNFGAGTLNAGDVYTFATTAPMWAGSDLHTARVALATQQKLQRSWLVEGDLPNSTFAGYVTTEADGYETHDDRFVYARASVRDRRPLYQASQIKKTMTGAPTLTFNAGAETITRSAGSFVTDGFAVGDVITISGSASNNITKDVTAVTATVLTLSGGLANEGPVGNVSIVGSNGLTFAAGGNTITRSGGSWLNDGFAVGDTLTIAGTASNNGTTPVITSLTATVATFGSGIVNEGPIRSDLTTITTGETTAAYVAAMDAAFASVDGERRIDMSIGRARVESLITGWSFRRPAKWALSIREYQHDVQIPNWRKSDGPLLGWDMTDGNGKVIEFDERTDGGALAARFSCLRTYANGPNGSFSALSLTRATEGSLLSRTHNMAVADVACTVTQAATELAIGQVLQLDDAGHGTADSLQTIEERVNSALQVALLQQKIEGPRASKAVWTASKTDILNIPGATLTGTLDLELNGTIEQIATRVRIQTAG